METIPINLEHNFLILFLIFISVGVVAFFSSSEAALMSVNKIKIKHLIDEKGNEKAKAVSRVLDRHDRLFGTILATENLFIILATSSGTALAVNYLGESGIILATFLMTIFIVIFGEITPKTYAAQNAEKIALLVSRPIEKIIKFMSPVISIFAALANLIVKILGGEPKQNPYLLTEEEIKTVIDVGEKEGVLAKGKKEMLKGVFEFGDTLSREVMTPRVEMLCLPKDALLSEVIQVIRKTGHSRIPIYDDNIDNIIGITYAKDLLFIQGDKYNLPIKNYIRPCYFAPASQKLIKLLTELQKRRSSIAIIIDEFGQTSGLITIERLLEEIVGEIKDEYDQEDLYYSQIKEGIAILDAKTNLEEVNQRLNLKLPFGDYQSLGGFLIHLLGRIPVKGERIEFKDIEFYIEEMEGYKLNKIMIINKSLQKIRKEKENKEKKI